MKNTIAVIVCWFGEWPWYINYFLHSVNANTSVDFILISDLTPTVTLPANIKLIKKTLHDIQKTISHKLSIHANLTEPYKLCDFKPVYGLIFEEHLINYNFWGHCDLDIILGDIRGFITEDVLSTYDIISPYDKYITGCFALYRNNEKMKWLFSKSKDYKKVFEERLYYAFDECNALQFLLNRGHHLDSLESEIESMTHVVKKCEKTNEIKVLFQLYCIESVPGKIVWTNGRLVLNNTYELMAYHLFNFKHEPFLYIPSDTQIADSFYIHKHSISNYSNKTLKGKLELMTSWFIKLHYFNRFFSTWIIKYSFISTKINDFINQNLDTILGRYSLRAPLKTTYSFPSPTLVFENLRLEGT